MKTAFFSPIFSRPVFAPLTLLAALAVAPGAAHALASPADPIYVDNEATAGDGSPANPWTGWDSAISWVPNVPYHFREGWYAFAGAPSSWSQANMLLLGTPQTVLKYNGGPTSGAVVAFNGGTGGTIGGIVFENFIIDGGGNAADGLYINTIGRSRFDNIRIRNVTTNGFNLSFNVLNVFTNPRVSEPTGTTSAMPSTLMRIGPQATNAGNYSSANTVINPILENVPGAIGIEMLGGTAQSVVIGGTMEGLGTGISICADHTLCSRNTFTGADLEGNSVADIIIDRSESNQFNNVIAGSTPPSTNGNGGFTVELTRNAGNNQFIGGNLGSILERGQNNSFINVATHWSQVDSYRTKAAFINVRDLGDASTRTILPTNTSIGPSGLAFTNSFVKTASLTFPAPTGTPEVTTKSVFIHNSVAVGDVVTVSYDDVIPGGLILDGYVDPSTPQNVVVRWTKIPGSGASIPSGGNYKIVVMQ